MNKKEGLVWKKYFDEDFIEYDTDYYTTKGESASKKEKFKIQRYPYLVVNSMTDVVLAENPKVTFANKEIDILQEEDYRSALAGVFGYGEVVIIPSMKDDELEYEMMPSCDVDYTEVDGELKVLQYTRVTSKYDYNKEEWVDDQIVVRHEVVDNAYTISENNQEIKTFRSEVMAPKIIKNKNLLGSGLPIYATATGVIHDLNICDLEKHFDRELSQKTILLPQNVVKQGKSDANKKRNANAVGFINDKTRRFRLIPSIDTAKQEPLIVDGDYGIEKYLSDKNSGLHMLSMHCGFGSNYFSENQESGLQTATAVINSKSTLFRSKKIHDKTLKEIIEAMFRGWLIFKGKEANKYKELQITFSDSIIQDDVAKQQQLLQEYSAGIITQEYYLMEVYGLSGTELEKQTADNFIDEVKYKKPEIEKDAQDL